MSTVLDVLIGVFVVYLVLSLVVSAATEWVASALKLRARTLQQAISRLLDGPGPVARPRITAASHLTPAVPSQPGEATKAFYAHPRVVALSSPKHPPSYIPAPVFAEVAAELIAKGHVGETAPVHAAGDDTRLQAMFNDTMERTTGWYKRVAQATTLVIAGAITILANADTLQLTHALWTNRSVREAAIARAQRLAANPPSDVVDAAYPQADKPISEVAADAEPVRSAEATITAAPEQEDFSLLGQLIGWGPDYRRINARQCALKSAERDQVCGDPHQRDACRRLLSAIDDDPRCAVDGSRLEATAIFPGTNFLDPSAVLPLAVSHLLGWILTIAAISFGAPFWFDTLSRFLNIRGSGKAPRAVAVLIVFVVLARQPLEAAEVLLKNSWIIAHRNRATVTTPFTVDETHTHPNPVGEGSDDGDLHVAGRAQDIGLPLVFEIANARLDAFDPVLTRVAAAVSAKETVTVSGVWRLWFEHAGKGPQTQGDAVPVPTNANPDHLFEIHPATRFDTFSLSPAFVPIEGYTAHDVKKVFAHYEKRVFTVERGATFTSITSTKAAYNYAAFTMILAAPPTKIADGLVVLADVRSPDGASLVSQPRRMVFVGGTRPAEIVQHAKKGDRLDAIGVPRVNLDLVWALSAPGQPVNLKGAYEMIVVGVRE